MKRRILPISLMIIVFSFIMTLNNCKEDPPGPCVPPSPPSVQNKITRNVGETINLTASSSDDATYSWIGPKNFTSTEQNPTITSATEDMAGEYRCTVTIAGCTSASAVTHVIVIGILEDVRDGKTYKTIRIGTQTWMAENLKWMDPTFSADWKIWNGDPNIGAIYGTLYNYNGSTKAALGLKPWRVPTDADWQKLINYLGGEMVAGSKLKEEYGISPAHWKNGNKDATNTSGFTAFGSGQYDVATNLKFVDIQEMTYFWSQTPYDPYIYIYKLTTNDGYASQEYGYKENFYSIRLVKD